MTTKACVGCGEVKRVQEFNLNGYGSRRSKCRACQSVYRKAFAERPQKPRKKRELAVVYMYPKFPNHGVRCWVCRNRTGKATEPSLCHVCAKGVGEPQVKRAAHHNAS